jgi:zinc protease
VLLTLLPLALAGDPVLDALHLEPRVEVLDNGLTLILHEDHRAPVVATSLVYKVGSAEDRPGRTGKAHLFEHLMFEGSANVPAGAFDTWLAEAGAVNNAWTDLDWTAYTIQGPPGALELALFLESDRLGWLPHGLTDEALENQRGVVSNERLGDETDDNSWPIYALEAALWPEDHPYHWPIVGTMEDINGVSRGELMAFFSRWYVPGNAAMVVVGDFETEAALAAARAYLGAVPEKPPPERPLVESPPLAGEHRRVFYEDMDDAQLYLAWRTVPEGHPDEAALDLLSELIAGGRGRPLDDKLYYRRARTTGVGAWSWNGRLGGEFVIWATRDSEPLEPLIKHIDRELTRIREAPPSQEEVDRVLARWKTQTLQSLEDHASLADALGLCWARFDTPDCLDSDLARYLAVTPEDVQRVAQTWLTDDRLILSVLSFQEAALAVPGSAPVVPP